MNAPGLPPTTLGPLNEARFENTLVDALPADPVLHNMPRQVRNIAYSRAVISSALGNFLFR